MVLTKVFWRRLALLVVLVALPMGCGESAESELPEVYSVRGEVVQLPSPDNPASSFLVHHEAIPMFLNANGQVEPMPEMTMEFPPAAGLDVSQLNVGDKVRLTFEVSWSGPNKGWEATKVDVLLPDTPLDFAKGSAMDHAGHGDHSGH